MLAVLRIRIRDPGSSDFFYLSIRDPDPGSGMENKAGSGIRDEHPKSFSRELRNSLGLKNTDPDPETESF
jgi:hypothetical protein